MASALKHMRKLGFNRDLKFRIFDGLLEYPRFPKTAKELDDAMILREVSAHEYIVFETQFKAKKAIDSKVEALNQIRKLAPEAGFGDVIPVLEEIGLFSDSMMKKTDDSMFHFTLLNYYCSVLERMV